MVDAKSRYDPTASGGDAFMHGMEEAIQTILHRARQDSPVFWSQTYRTENVRGGTVQHAVFAGEQASHCLCGWTREHQCHVPIACDALDPEEYMRTAWVRLCNATYTAREDVYDLIHILQHSVFDPAVASSCLDLVPDVI